MKLKQLQALLEDVEAFEKPKIELEQFATGVRRLALRSCLAWQQAERFRLPCPGAHIAARILHVAHGLGDVQDCAVVDLGCGCGVLGIAAVLMGAGHVVRLLALPGVRCAPRLLTRAAACGPAGR
jgi:predicted RNA methylase